MKIGVLTSSRADFGIYLPLLKKLEAISGVHLKIIAFGTHCSPHHGYTLKEIKEAGFRTIDTISSLLVNDNEEGIATAYGLTIIKFSEYWSSHNYDLVFCLGDRFEMSAAVQAGIPFGVKYAHLHGGEITLGAIDNIYRHQITLASHLHFTSTEEYAKRVSQIINAHDNIYNVGALSLDGIEELDILSNNQFYEKYDVPNSEFILATFHPETENSDLNEKYAKEMKEALKKLTMQFHIVITMPNADILGSLFREKLRDLKKQLPESITLIENFGKQGYFSAMRHARLLLGNSSSGIIEAASFQKYVVNVGERQKGRAQSSNIFNCDFNSNDILKTVRDANQSGEYHGQNIYYQNGTADRIIEVIRQII